MSRTHAHSHSELDAKIKYRINSQSVCYYACIYGQSLWTGFLARFFPSKVGLPLISSYQALIKGPPPLPPSPPRLPTSKRARALLLTNPVKLQIFIKVAGVCMQGSDVSHLQFTISGRLPTTLKAKLILYNFAHDDLHVKAICKVCEPAYLLHYSLQSPEHFQACNNCVRTPNAISDHHQPTKNHHFFFFLIS